ncbi:MAG: DUF2953 domain-containing protein [Bacillota bacterium]
MTAIIVTGAVVLVLVLVPLSRIRVHLRFKRRGEDDRIRVGVAWLKYLRYSLDVALVDLLVQSRPGIRFETKKGLPETVPAGDPEETTVPFGSLFAVYKKYGGYLFALFYLAGRTRIRRFCWYTEIGTGEVHHTGLAVGVAWAAKGTLVSGLYALCAPAAKPELAVFPDYEHRRFRTSLDCIFDVRIGHIMMTGLKVLWRSRGERIWQWNRTPSKDL